MRVACPTCGTIYEVPESQFGGRPRRLRCEQCGHGWRALPDGSPLLEPDMSNAPAPEALPPAPRPFGQPVDAAADREMQEAMAREEAAPRQLVESVPAEAGPQEAAPLSPPPLPESPAEPDRFADLVHAARNRTVEVEPDQPRRQRPAANPALIALLVILLLLVLAVLERGWIMRVLPGTAKLFHALHLA